MSENPETTSLSDPTDSVPESQVTNLTTDPAAQAPLASPAASDNATALATTADVQAQNETPTTLIQGGTTSNPTTTTIWSIQPTDPTKGPFQAVLGGSQFNSTWDSVLYLGYNGAGGGTAVLASEPLLTWNIEQDYEYPPGNHVMETYAEFRNAARTQHVRPWFAQINRSTGSTSFLIDVHDSNGFFSVNGGSATQYMKVCAGNFLTFGLALTMFASDRSTRTFLVDLLGNPTSNGGVLTMNDGGGSSGQKLILQANGSYGSSAIRTASATQPLFLCPTGARVGIGANGFNYNAALQIRPAAATDALSIESTSGSPSYQFLKIDQYGHQIVGGPAPSIEAGVGAGTGPTVALGGNDVVGVITVTTGSSPTASAIVATVTFSAAFAATPKAILLTPAEPNAAALAGAAAVYEDLASRSMTGFKLKVLGTPLAATTTYQWNYYVVG
jgi:hypothetical protein